MKKFTFLASALALCAFAFTSCDKENKLDIDSMLEDGFYVTGPATGSDKVEAKYMMTAGINEVTKELRDGMYEKYVALKADTDFTLILHENGKDVNYTAALELFDTNEEGEQPKEFLRGDLEINGTKSMQVKKDGLYHIVLDLNKDGLIGNAQIVVAEANWGVRGAMNGWDYTPMKASKFDFNTITYTLKGVEVPSDGGFKFSYCKGWKINLDLIGQVKAETNLGNDAKEVVDLMSDGLKSGGKDIAIKRGVYDIELVWKLSGGAFSKNYTAKLVKTGMPEPINYTDCVLEVIGAGIPEQEGSVPDKFWGNWGNAKVADNAGKPTVEGTKYTWTWTNLSIVEDGFKIRTKDDADQGKIRKFDLGKDIVDTSKSVELLDSNDIKVAAGKYNITLIISATPEKEERTIIITVAK